MGGALENLLDEVNRLGRPKNGFARRCDISPQYLGDIIHGHRPLTPRLIDVFCARLNLNEKMRKACHKEAARAAGWDI